jgi:hypothetical protein
MNSSLFKKGFFFQWEYMMVKSIWIISCLIIFLPWSRVHQLPQFHLKQQHHIDQLLETWECYLMPQLRHDLLELFDMVIYSAIHIDWSILHSPPPPKQNYPKPSPSITFRILNVNLTLVIIIFSLPCVQTHEDNCATISWKESANSALPKEIYDCQTMWRFGCHKTQVIRP